MSATIEQRKTGDAMQYGGVFVPLTSTLASGLLAAYFFRGTPAARRYTNLLYGKNQIAGKVGTPTEAAGYLGLKSRTNYVDSGIPGAATQTILVICRNTDTNVAPASQPFFMGTYGNGGIGFGIHMDGVGAVAWRTAYATGNSDVAVSLSMTNWRALAMVREAGVGMIAYDLTAGTAAVKTNASVCNLGTGNILIGSAAHTAYQGTSDVSAAFIANAALSLADLRELAGKAAGVMALNGLSLTVAP